MEFTFQQGYIYRARKGGGVHIPTSLGKGAANFFIFAKYLQKLNKQNRGT
jgi:hypothetical protein